MKTPTTRIETDRWSRSWLRTLLAFVLCLAAVPALGAQPGEVMTATAESQRIKTAPGDQFAVAIVLTFADGWHAWPNKPVVPQGMDDLVTIPTELKIPKDAPAPVGVNVHLDRAQWPEPHTIESAAFTGDPIKILSYSGRAVIYVPVTIGADAKPGEVIISFAVSYQACDDSTCRPPTTAEAGVKFEIGAPGAVETTKSEATFKDFKPTVFAEILRGTSPPTPAPAVNGGAVQPASPTPEPSTSLFGIQLPDPRGPVGLALLLVVSFLGGAILNLTPCVLPVIPIKVMTLTQHAAADGKHTSALGLGLWMALGIVIFWTAIGVPMAFISSALDPSRFIFGTWWVTLGLGLIIVAMGLGIMGMFNLTLPQSLYSINPKADTAWGSFVFGIMTAILGLPCFGFVAGGLLAAAATMPAISTMSVFIGIGAGMAAPFLVLAAKPELVKKMPRTGPASELVKQVMGLMLLAAAAFFIATGLKTLIADKPYLGPLMRWWSPAFFLGLAAVWLVVRTFQLTKNPVRRSVFTLVALLLMLSVVFAWSETAIERDNYLKLNAAGAHDNSFVTGAWNHYSPGKFDKARAAGKIVVADFTADWCLICKTLKRGVLDVDPVRAELLKDDIVPFEVDLSNESAPGWKFLNSLGRTGIPTLAIFTPGVEQPEIFNAYTSTTVMDALTRAREKAAGKKATPPSK